MNFKRALATTDPYRFLIRIMIGIMLLSIGTFHPVFSQQEKFKKRTLVSNLNSPWEITYGPNDSLWVTECMNYKIYRISVKTGKATMLLDISKNKNFGPNEGKWPQGGLMGLALHPDLYAKDFKKRMENPYVYIAYVYEKVKKINPSSSDQDSAGYFKTKIVRYTYAHEQLLHPVTILDNIPGSNDHNSGRLVIGPSQENPASYFLYYTVGDMGAGQFNNINRANHAQNIDVLEGKVLRLNTKPDTAFGDHGRWIPRDNPFRKDSSVSVRDYVYSFGHRNAQGMISGVINGKHYLYSSEHGPQSDDEINIIQKGKNYGWNRIAGYKDNNYNGRVLGGFGPVDEKGFPYESEEPILSFVAPDREQLAALSSDSYTWPSVAPSSIDFYPFSTIPGWKNSLLVPTLKAGKVLRLKLNDAGDGIATYEGKAVIQSLFAGEGRFRDIAISPDGSRIYVACDKGGRAVGIRGKLNKEGKPPKNAGSILEFTYQKQ